MNTRDFYKLLLTYFHVYFIEQDGNTLLHLAADEGNIEYVKLLLAWGVDTRIISQVRTGTIPTGSQFGFYSKVVILYRGLVNYTHINYVALF